MTDYGSFAQGDGFFTGERGRLVLSLPLSKFHSTSDTHRISYSYSSFHSVYV